LCVLAFDSFARALGSFSQVFLYSRQGTILLWILSFGSQPHFGLTVYMHRIRKDQVLFRRQTEAKGECCPSNLACLPLKQNWLTGNLRETFASCFKVYRFHLRLLLTAISKVCFLQQHLWFSSFSNLDWSSIKVTDP